MHKLRKLDYPHFTTKHIRNHMEGLTNQLKDLEWTVNGLRDEEMKVSRVGGRTRTWCYMYSPYVVLNLDEILTQC